MKKFTILFVCMLAFAGIARSQFTEDFEHIRLNIMLGGEEDDSYFKVVPNPDPGEANPSSHVAMLQRSMYGVPWGGFWSRLETAVDVSTYKYVYVDVWKPRISPLRFKLEDGPSGNLEIESMTPQTKVGEWETIVFNFSEKTGTWNVIAFMPDFADPIGLEEDIVLYFDNIRLGGAPGGAEGGYMVENFEHIPLNWFAAGDDAYMHVVANPDFENEVNTSGYVVEFNRGKGDPWGGFWSPLTAPLDLTENKYMYVDVWKPMISRVVFKLEGSVQGAANVELPSMNAQTKVGEWETLVFDFSEVGGQWNTIVFFPDFPESGDDVADEYIIMYFDNIRQGGAPDGGTYVPDVTLYQPFNFSVFPNPATDLIYVNAEKEAMITLLDIRGNMISQKQVTDSAVYFELSGLAKGVYLIRVVSKETSGTQKFIFH